MKVNELEKSTTPIGARVNAHFIALLKEASIPVSSVVENMIGYFLTLSDDEKNEMLSRYSPQNIEVEQLRYPKSMLTNHSSVESIREVLMHANIDELKILSEYCIEFNKNHLMHDEPCLRYSWVNDLILNFQAVAKNFFSNKMEYGELLTYIADDMDIKLERKMDIHSDHMELIIAKEYIKKHLPYIQYKEKSDLFQILGLQNRKSGVEDEVIKVMLSTELQDNVNYHLLCWLAKTNLQSFIGEISFWDATGGEVFYERKKFREYILYPTIHIAMLRGKYRRSQLPECSVCHNLILLGSKFCNECGAKLV